MDIDLLAKMVKEVMMDHDAVTLPGVGAFMADLVPASFADKGYTIHPPYRRLSFMPRQGNDTLLVDLYATSNGISRDDATQILVAFLSEMKEQLMVRKTIVFPGLGRLRATRENHFFFVADEDLDIYPAGFGLEPISLKTHVETPEEVAATVSSLAAELLGPEPALPEAAPAAEMADQVGHDAEPEEEMAGQAGHDEASVEEMADQVGHDAEPEEEMAGQAGQDVVPAPERKKRSWKGLWITLGVMAALVLLAAAALAIVGRVAPAWLDPFLYTPEQLEVLYP